MSRPILQFKTLDHFQGPLNYATMGSAAIDLRLPESLVLCPGEEHLVHTGLCLDMSRRKDIAAIIIPRSGLGSRGLIVRNQVGLIDSDYQGEIMVKLRNDNIAGDNEMIGPGHSKTFVLDLGDRFCQMFFTPIIHPILEEQEQFDNETERGDGAYGSSGNS